MIAYFRTLLARVDASLLEEWQERVEGAPARGAAGEEPANEGAPLLDARDFEARVRSEFHHLIRCLARRDYEAACDAVHQDRDDPWDAARFEAALREFYEEFDTLLFQPRSRAAHLMRLRERDAHTFDVSHVLCDDREEDMWVIEAEVQAGALPLPETPLLRLRRIGT